MGHNSGDEILCNVAKNIEGSLGKEDVVARMGGDEFVVFTVFTDIEEIGGKMDAIIERLNHGFEVFGYNINISLSIGVAVYPEHGTDLEGIVKKADTAMYSVKRDGLSAYRVYTSEMEKKRRATD
jgi:diguanylate cyclase (GGDEF)-like protein